MTDPIGTDASPHRLGLDPPHGAIRPPEPDGLADARAAFERTLGERDMDQHALGDYRSLLAASLTPGRPVFRLAWPRSWFIPGEADFRQHWPAEPPSANRYDWAVPSALVRGPGGDVASSATGRLFAMGNASHLGPARVGSASTGIYLQPTEALATYRLGADIDAVTEWRWSFMPTRWGGSGTVSYRCQAYLVAWQSNPVDGSWQLLRPYGSRVLVKTSESGAGYRPAEREVHAFGDLHVDVQLQGGRTYAIGVSFEVEVKAAISDGQRGSYVPQPGDEIALWAVMFGDVPLITARPIRVLIP